MRSVLVTLAAVASLAGCGGYEREAQKAVKDQLKDPESAQFGEYTEVRVNDGRRACLGVNAKNAMGGYTGEQQAFLHRDEKSGEWDVDFEDVSHGFCVQRLREYKNMDEVEAAVRQAKEDLERGNRVLNEAK